MKIVAILFGVLVVLVLVVWLGLQVKPKPFPTLVMGSALAETLPLPANLPAPVDRFYRTVYGDEIPIIRSVVISGRASMRVNGITFPARFRFTHDPGQDYHHYIEATLFGWPIMKVNEYYLDGSGRMEMPFGVIEGEPKIDQAANLGLWAETVWFPSIYLTDSRTHWEAVDSNTALLFVPFGDVEETFIVRFNPESGLIHMIEAMRYRDASDDRKTLWINQALSWGKINGQDILTVGAVTWLDQGRPWAIFSVEELNYNLDVSEYIRSPGL
jgi:hypothetical protein